MNNIEKIEINGHYVWVDKDAEIKEGDWYYLPRTNTPYLCQADPTELEMEKRFGVCKIIAASLELNLEGVPTYVEWLADIDSKNHYIDQSDYWAIGYDSFKRGYQTAEKQLPTWDDVRKAIELAKKGNHTIVFEDFIKPLYSTEEIMVQLKSSKMTQHP